MSKAHIQVSIFKSIKQRFNKKKLFIDTISTAKLTKSIFQNLLLQARLVYVTTIIVSRAWKHSHTCLFCRIENAQQKIII